MAGAGDYPTRFQWSTRSLGDPDTFGAKPDEYAATGYLWGVLEDVTAAEEEETEVTRQATRGTIRVRNYPAVQPADTLRDVGLDTTWRVESVHRGVNEMVCEVRRP